MGCRHFGDIVMGKEHVAHLQRGTNKNAKHISGYDSLSQSMLGFCLDLMPFCWDSVVTHRGACISGRGSTGECLGDSWAPWPFETRNIRLVQQEFVPV